MNNMSDSAQIIVENLGYPYKIFASGTPYDNIVNEYNKAFKDGKNKGFTPVLIPTSDTLADYLGYLKDENYSAQNTLKEEVEPGKKILEQRFAEYTEYLEEDYNMNMKDFIGEYNDKPEVMSEFSSLYDYSTNDTIETILFEIPTTNPWEIVAYVPFGGWNECPSPEEMMSICKYWYEQYGAVPVTITHDVLEMTLPSPVGKEKALEVAKEHYAFTPDRVDQGTQTGTVSEVAASVAVSDVWFFWWD